MFTLIIVLAFSPPNGYTGVSPSATTIQVDRLEKDKCEAMLKAVTTSVIGAGSQVRLAGCYPR